MAEIAGGTAYSPPRRRFDVRELSRLAGWGLTALGALTVAAYIASFEIAEDRLILAVAHIRGVPPPERLARGPADRQQRQLTETVRELSTDRDHLLARLDSLERNVGDITGSIARPINPAAAAAPPIIETPPPIIAAPEAIPVPQAAPRAAPLAAPAAEESAASKTEFGIDLGRANNVEGLRQLWTTVKGKHGAVLEGLRPVVAVREISRAGGVELRLVAGPIVNAAAAARICATLTGAACHPTVFDGQRLALR